MFNRDFKVKLERKETLVSFFSEAQAEAALSLSPKGKLLTVCDRNTAELFPDDDPDRYIIPPGEQFKILDTVQDLSFWALNRGAGRDACFLAVGGGVVCDLTAFTASIYMRGVDVVLLPTSLLSMVDASLGGKTGVDFQGYKNILGTFHPAKEVRILPSVLKTLSTREYYSGLAELIKHSLLRDAKLYDMIKNKISRIKDRDSRLLEELIYRSLRVKSFYIEEDPYDRDIRGHLNLGHTFAHALESEGRLSAWTHGEAVAWGIDRVLEAGVLMGVCDPNYAEEVRKLLSDFDYHLEYRPADPESMIEAMGRDKKKAGGELRFILQSRWAETFYAGIPTEVLMRVLS